MVVPYEVAFQGFSSQLASVMAGLLALPHCFIVTNLVVEPAATAAAPTEEQSPAFDYMSRYGLNRGDPGAMMRSRYGMGGRYGPIMAPPPPPVRPVKRGPNTVLDEKPLRFTLSLQAVKLKPKK